MLGLNEPGEEKRQCVTKTMAAGVLWRRLGRRPTLDEVNEEDRRASRKPRRLGVTPGMLVQIGNQFLNTPGTFGEVKVDAMMVQAALLTAWFFMMRASEFCDSSGLNLEGVLRGVDVKLTKDGEPAEFGCADEVTVQFQKTKADQEAFGSCKAMGFPMPGQSHGLYRIVCPDRFQGMDAERPLFVWGNGSMLRRTEVQFLLQKAAKAEGLPSERFLSHSLRIGGASALYQVFGNIELVKRMGRWSSSTVQRYLFDGGDVVKQLSVKMADLDRRIHYS